MDVTLAGSVRLTTEVHPAKAHAPMVVRLFGSVRLVREEQKAKA